MKFSHTLALLLAGSTLLPGLSVAAALPDFSLTPLNCPDGFANCRIEQTSDDGQTLTFSVRQGDTRHNFVWQQGRFTKLPSFGTTGVNIVMALSQDGSTLVGHNASRGFRWHQDSGLEQVAPLKNNFITNLIDVSADGSRAVGYAGWQSNLHAFVHEFGKPPRDLTDSPNSDDYRLATRISGNGQVVAGYTGKQVFLWRDRLGFSYLKPPADCQKQLLNPEAISHDGQTLLLRCSLDRGYLWQKTTGYQPLALPEGIVEALPSFMSADAGVITGTGGTSKGLSGNEKEPILWFGPGQPVRLFQPVAKTLGRSDIQRISIADISASGHRLTINLTLADGSNQPLLLTFNSLTPPL